MMKVDKIMFRVTSLLCQQLSIVGCADACVIPWAGRVVIVTKARRSRKNNKIKLNKTKEKTAVHWQIIDRPTRKHPGTPIDQSTPAIANLLSGCSCVQCARVCACVQGRRGGGHKKNICTGTYHHDVVLLTPRTRVRDLLGYGDTLEGSKAIFLKTTRIIKKSIEQLKMQR